MALGARNQFVGKTLSVKSDSVMSEVTLDIGGGNDIVSLISASSAKRLKLKKAAAAVAFIKATEVILSTRNLRFAYRRAWLLVDATNGSWPQPLVATGGARGGGARLTPLGAHVLRSYRDLQHFPDANPFPELPNV